MTSPRIAVISICVINYVYLSTVTSNSYIEDEIRPCESHLCRDRIGPFQSCKCDSDCHLYDDCCIDAPPTESTSKYLPAVSCIEISNFMNINAVKTCDPNWNGPAEVPAKCKYPDHTDPLLAAPVTDVRTNITYNNYYCVVCNNVVSEGLKTWIVETACPLTQELYYSDKATVEGYLWENLYYNVELNLWGVDMIANYRNVFYPCTMNFGIGDFGDHVRTCIPNIISTCDSNQQWKDSLIQQCEGYMGVIYHASRAYRNPHCAMCNNVLLRDTICASIELTGFAAGAKPPMSFTLLLDVNMKDGSKVGEVKDTRCPDGEKWDPFFNKCRIVVCALPGFTLVDGKCVET